LCGVVSSELCWVGWGPLALGKGEGRRVFNVVVVLCSHLPIMRVVLGWGWAQTWLGVDWGNDGCCGKDKQYGKGLGVV